MTCFLMCKISINLSKIRSQCVTCFLMCKIWINLDKIRSQFVTCFLLCNHSYIPNALQILHIYFITCFWHSLYIIFTYFVQTNWKGLKGRLVDRQTNNLTYWTSTLSRCVDLLLPTYVSIYHSNIKINKTFLYLL